MDTVGPLVELLYGAKDIAGAVAGGPALSSPSHLAGDLDVLGQYRGPGNWSWERGQYHGCCSRQFVCVCVCAIYLSIISRVIHMPVAHRLQILVFVIFVVRFVAKVGITIVRGMAVHVARGSCTIIRHHISFALSPVIIGKLRDVYVPETPVLSRFLVR